MNSNLKFNLRTLFSSMLAMLCLVLAADAWGAAQTWNSGSGNWFTGANGWNGNTTWADGDTASFAGSDGTYAITLTGTVKTGVGTSSAGGLAFANSGYTISANSSPYITLNVGNAAQASYITVGVGKTATIGNYVKLSKGTTSNGELDLFGGGTLTIGSGSGALGTSGGTLDLSGTSSSGNNSYIGGGSTLNVASDGTVKYSGGLLVGGTGGSSGNATVTVSGALAVGTGSATTAGSIILGYDATQTASATVTLNSGGTITTTRSGASAGGLRFGFTSAGGSWTRTFNLNGGTLTVNQIYVNVAGASSVFNFNGGTLQPLAANSTFMTGLTTANVRDNGAKIDVAGKAITIGQALTHSAIGGDAATDGGLTLSDSVGGGTLTLNNTETYTGPTVVSAGTLALGASATINSSANISIAAGATLDASALATFILTSNNKFTATGSSSAAAQLKGGSTGVNLNLRPATLNFTPTSFLGDTTHPALMVTAGTLSVGGSTITVVNNGGSPLGAGDYTLIKVSGTGAISGTPTLDTSSGVGAGTGMAANTSASLVYSGGNLVLRVTSALPSTTTTIALGGGWSSTSTYGDALQFNVLVTGATPTGTVTVRDGGIGGTVIGSGTLSGGSATITVNPLSSLTAGSHNNIVAVYAGDVNNQGSSSSPLATQTVNQKALTVSGAAAVGKCYDGTTAGAAITGSLNGVVGSDVVTLNGTGTFASAGPGTGIAVTSTSILGGAAAANYSLTQPTGLTADIVTTATWNVATGGTWEPAGNWLNSIVGTAGGNTADFSAVNITADATVTLSSTRTIGNLVFGDTDTSTAAGWTLTGSTLTLAGTTPTITVNALGTGKSAIISSIIAGSAGLTKTGNGTLALSTAVNTYSGGTKINGGTLSIGADARLGAVPGTLDPHNIVIDGGKLYLNSGSLVTSANRGVQINSGNATLDGVSGNIGIGGPMSGVGALTNASTTAQLITGANQHTYAGGTTLLSGSTTVAQTTSDGTGVNLTKGPFGSGPLTLAGGSFRVSNGGGPYEIGNAVTLAADTTISSGGLAFTMSGPMTLTGNRTLTQNSATSVTISGSIGEDVAGRALTKAGTGAGALILTAANSYSGATTISAGTLALSGSGSINNSPSIVLASSATFDVSTVSGGYVLGAGQTLSGEGSVTGAATINGTLAPGASIGTLNFSSGLTFTSGSSNHMELGNSLAADKAAAVGAVAYAGKLKLERVAGATLANGSYDLFDGASFSGAFSQLELANWDPAQRVSTNNLVVDGTVTIAANAAPVAKNLTNGVEQGGSTTIAIIGGKSGPTDADGDAMSITSVVLVTPANGGGFSVVGGTSVVYTASASFSGTDSFTYTVSDPFGATDTKTVTVVVDPAGTGANITGISGTSPTITVQALGVPNAVYQLQYTTNLTTVNWGDVSGSGGTATASSLNGTMTFTDTNATNASAWYRTRHVSGP